MADRIAIIGISCLFPGAQTPEEFWQNLLQERNSVTVATTKEMGVDPQLLFAAEKGTPDRMHNMYGGYIRDFEFNPANYELPQHILQDMDDLYQWSLYVAHQALLDSGYVEIQHPRTGVIMGNLSFPTRQSHNLVNPIYRQPTESALGELIGAPDFELPALAVDAGISPLNTAISGYPAALIAQAFRLGGVNFCLDAACASSLYAIKLACHYLQSHQTDLMLAGAVSGSDPANNNVGFSLFRALPGADEKNMPLSKASRGLIAAQGAGMLVLKRYDEAVRDGDKIYATILGGGLSNDGSGQHILVPKSEGQIRSYERAYDDAGIEPGSIQYVECHATGTPLGDTTELNSMETFFTEGIPAVGSVKSNLGHLLTAAGMTGVIKVILSMNAGMIPATIKVTNPLTPSSGNPVHIVTETTQWEAEVKRAAISAFGFGGCNAHLILGEADEATRPETHLEDVKLAITGMDTCFGELQNLDAFERAIHDSTQHFTALPEKRWKGVEDEADLLQKYQLETVPEGAYIEGFDIDFRYFKTPPLHDDRVAPQQLLMLRVADNAIKDAGLEKGGNVAVLIAMSSELSLHLFRTRYDLSWQVREGLRRAGINLAEDEVDALEDIAKEATQNWPQVNQYTSFIGNIIASRISALWDFNGPSFTISSGENSAFQALKIGQMLLAAGEVDAVLLGAVDLSAGAEHIFLRSQLIPVNNGTKTLSFDKNATGFNVGEGAGAVVLEREEDARTHQRRIYAIVDGFGMAQSPDTTAVPQPPSTATMQQAAQQALQHAKISAPDIGYLEVYASGDPAQDSAELAAMNTIYQQGDLDCAIGSVKANIGHTFTASGIASLIKTALCLYRRFIPGVPEWTAPDSDLSDNFYVPPYSRPWMLEAGGSQRIAALNSMGLDGAHVHVILSEDEQRPPATGHHLQNSRYKLFPVAITGDVNTALETLAQHITASRQTLAEDAAAAYQTYQQATKNSTLMLIADSHENLLSEIESARTGIPKAIKNGRDWKSRQGSFYAPAPVGQKGKVAFIFPGAFNPYPDMAAGLLYWFPYLHDYFVELSDSPGRITGEHVLYPRTQHIPNREEKRALEKRLQDDASSILQTGISYSVAGAKIMQELFGIKPAGVFGYSVGETSMMWAMNVVNDYAESRRLLDTSPLFTTRVVGRKEVVRENLNLPDSLPDDEVWGNYFIAAPLEKVKAAIANEPRVFLDQINTLQKMHICGYPPDVERVIEQLGARYVKSPFTNVLHNPAMESDYPRFLYLNGWTLNETNPDAAFYTSATYDTIPKPFTSELIAEMVSKSNVSQVDFPRLVDRVYDDGHRIFIELGARQTCTRWIKENLKGREHLALAFDVPGTNVDLAIMRLVAQLAAHHVSLDFSSLYPQPESGETATPRRKKLSLIDTVVPGGKRIRDTILTEDNIRQFEAVRNMTSNRKPEKPVPGLPAATTPGGNYPAYLQQQQQSLTQIETRLDARVQAIAEAADDAAASAVNTPPPADDPMETYPLPVPRQKGEGVIFDEYDMLEFARSGIAGVFGEEYAIIDTYSRRVRLPMPPYLLVSRITRLEAQTHQYEPCSITTEYDIPEDAWYSVDGQVPWAVTTESGQCDLLLISYLGIDFENKGERIYRLLDGTLNFLDELPKNGQRLRYDIDITTFARSGDSLLFFFQYDCYADDKLIMTMRNACAGFFSDEELAMGKGVIRKNQEIEARAKIQKQSWTAPLTPAKTSISKDEMLMLTEGDVAGVFGAAYTQGNQNKSLRLPPASILMIDRVTEMDVTGGLWGLGEMTGEKDLSPNDWYFISHFKDDNVLAGSLMAEACGQLLQTYMLSIGLQQYTDDARFQPVYDLPQIVRCRGQVIPKHKKLTYKLEVTDIGFEPTPYVRGNVEAWCEGRMVVHFTDLAMQLVEKVSDDRKPRANIEIRKPDAIFNEIQVEEFAVGDVSKCFGDDFKPWDVRKYSRIPNGDLQFISRVMEVNATRHNFEVGSNILAEYDVPQHPWWHDDNAYPIEPYSVVMEMGLQPCGFLSAHLGSVFLYPELDVFFRNLDGTGEFLRPINLAGKTIQNRATLTSATDFQGMIIQKFTYEMFHDGEPFFRGTASFGYFSQEALAAQIGLDSGKEVPPWYQQNPDVEALRYDLTDPAWRQTLYQAAGDKPHWKLSEKRLDLLEEIIVANKDGNWSYVYGSDMVNADDWFYRAHFKGDPVMPGSLGVEAVLQAMQAYAIVMQLGEQFQNPYFEQIAPHETVWKYRGQVLQTAEKMSLEAHIKSIEADEHGYVMLADAYVWNGARRIYQITDLALAIREGQ